MNPLVTITVPTRNRALTLRRSLETFLGQDYSPIEVIISDNGSTDGTEALCCDLERRDPRVRYVRHAENIGLHGNLNFCLASGEGEFLCIFHDHDDHDLTLISTYVAFLRAHPDVALVCSNWELINEEGRVLGIRDQDVPPVTPGMEFIERTIRAGRSAVGIPGAMIRRSAIGAARFVADAPVGFGDFPVWFEIAERWSVGHVDGRLWRWTQSNTSQSAGTVTSMATQYEDNIMRYCAAHLTRWPEHRDIVARWQASMRRYLFWALAYEMALYASSLDSSGRPTTVPSDGSATRYELMGYRLQPDEVREALTQFRSYRAGIGQYAVWLAITVLVRLNVTWPLAWGVRHHEWLRTVLRLS